MPGMDEILAVLDTRGFSLLMDRMIDGIIVVDADNRLRAINNAALNLLKLRTGMKDKKTTGSGVSSVGERPLGGGRLSVEGKASVDRPGPTVAAPESAGSSATRFSAGQWYGQQSKNYSGQGKCQFTLQGN